jgi:hypothetical protein
MLTVKRSILDLGAIVRTPRTLTESRCPVLRRSDSGLWIPVGDEAA